MTWTNSNRPRLGTTKLIDGVTYTVKSIWQGGVVCNGERIFTAEQWVAL